MFDKHNALHRALAALAGAIFPLAFAPLQQAWLALPSLAILAALLLRVTPRLAFQCGLIWGLAAFGIGVSWVHVAISEFGGAPLYLSVGLTAGMVAILALYPALTLWALVRFFASPGARLLAFAPLWFVSEWLRGLLFSGFPWLFAGYSQTDTFLAALAPLFSVYGISVALAVFAALSAAALLRPAPVAWPMPVQRLWKISPALLILLLAVLPAPRRDDPATDVKPVRVAMVQANIAQQLKWRPEELQNIVDQYFSLTDPLLGRADLVIWPEAAIPAFAHQLQNVLTPLHNAAQEKNTALWIGLPVSQGEQYYNSVIGLGTADGRYDKRQLVPFGEYVPFESLLRGLFAFFNLPMSGFSAGERAQLIRSPVLQAAGAICYEIAYPQLVRDNVRALGDQPGVLLTVSNDAWFGQSWGPHQHLQIARMRALESGLPLLRTTVTGITAAVSADGRLRATLPAYTQGILRTNVIAARADSLWIRMGMWPLLAVVLVLTGFAIGIERLKKRSNPPKSPPAMK